MTSRETEPRVRRDGPGVDHDAEQDVDLGRYWSALAARWWLAIAGAALGAVIGILATLGASRAFEARGVVYLGTPFGPGGTNALQNLNTRLATLNEFIRSREVVREVAAKAGMRPVDVRRGLATEAVSGIVREKGPSSPSPLVAVTVDYRAARPANAAVDEIMARVVRAFSTYVDLKLQNYQTRRKRAERVLNEVNADIAEALRRQETLRSNRAGLDPAAQLILLANISNTLQFNESRQANLEGSLLTLRELIAQATQVERARVIEPASADRVSGPSKRTGAVVGAVIGLILGALAALLWEPVARRVRARGAR